MIFPGVVRFGSKALGDVPYYQADDPSWKVLSTDPIDTVSSLPVGGSRLPVLPDGSPDWRYVVPGLTVAPDSQGKAKYTLTPAASGSSWLSQNSTLVLGGAGLVLLLVAMRRH